MQALVLTAGLGTRLRPHTETVAKPAIPFLNVPMLGYSLFLLENIGLKNVVFNTHHAPESIKNCVQRMSGSSYSVNLSHEDKILGSGGALWKSSSFFDQTQPVFLLNGDNIAIFNDPLVLKKLTDFHYDNDALATLLCCPHTEVGKSLGGVYVGKTVSEAGFDWAPVHTFSKTPVEGFEGFHFASVILLSPRIFPLLPNGSSNILYEVLGAAIQRGEKVLSYIDRGVQWFETGDPNNYLEATRVCLNTLNQNSSHSRYLEAVLKRFTPGWDNYKRENIFSISPLPDTVSISSGARGLIGRGASLADGVQLKNFFVIGDVSTLSQGSQMDASVLFPGKKLEKDEKLHSTLR